MASRSLSSKSYASKGYASKGMATSSPSSSVPFGRATQSVSSGMIVDAEDTMDGDATVVTIGAKRVVVKHCMGNAMRYGKNEDEAELYVLLKNLYTVKHDNRASFRVLGRLRTDKKNGAQGLEWVDVPREAPGMYLKKSDEEIPALLARLSGEQNVRREFEKELRRVHPVQYRKFRHRRGMTAVDDIMDDLELSETAGSITGSIASMTSMLPNLASLKGELRNLLEDNTEMQIIFLKGREVFAPGLHDDKVEIPEEEADTSSPAKPPGTAPARSKARKFLPLKHEITEERLIRQWAQSVLQHPIVKKNPSENKRIVQKFMKLRMHVGYRFEDISTEAAFEAILRQVFPVQSNADNDAQWALVAQEGEEPNAPLWKKKVAFALKQKAEQAKLAKKNLSSTEDVENGPPSKKQKTTGKGKK
ncbi:unnamed protein product [Amoebophrya sp. A25]|nr:unnamed protein product [Amoebophrya sp. A25]|eukprot:GSA25T00000368001.1